MTLRTRPNSFETSPVRNFSRTGCPSPTVVRPMKQVPVAVAFLLTTLAIAAPVTTAPGTSVPSSVSETLTGIVDCPTVKVQWCWEVSPDPECPVLGEWGWIFDSPSDTKGFIYLIPVDCEAVVPGTECGWFHIWQRSCG